MSETLNKDGTPRKKGSGKTKGAGCFSKVSWSTLKNFVADDVKIPVSRVWLRSLGALPEKQLASVKLSTVPKRLPPPKQPLPKTINPPAVEKQSKVSDDQEYEPPPLFATNPRDFYEY